MLNVPVALICKVLSQVHCFQIPFHVLICNIANPGWHCCRKKTNLKITSLLLANDAQNFLNVLLETEFEHLVSFIEYDCLYVRKVDVTSFDMIKHTSCCTNKDFNALF